MTQGGVGTLGRRGDVLVPRQLRVTFEPVLDVPTLAHAAGGPRLGLDGPTVKCAFETSWCRGHAALAGGLDEHHRWPKSLGGPEDPTDVQGLLILCPLHHRRQHALVRAMVEAGATTIHTVRYFAPVEWQTAAYAVGQWLSAGRPRIAGWPCPAAAVKAVAA